MLFCKKKYKTPFVYLSAMPRSGSTMLSGLLTIPNISIIFSEPGFQRGLHHNLEQFQEVSDVDINLLSRYEGDANKMLRVFYNKITPHILKEFPMIGVKECFMQNWNVYEDFFDDVRYVILARDPRDVFLSLSDYGENVAWHKKMWLEKGIQYIADAHNQIWEEQQVIINTRNCYLVRYEDFCMGKVSLQEIKSFLGINSLESGDVAGILKNYKWRQWEVLKNGNKISRGSVFRWKDPYLDQELLAYSKKFGNMMQEYIDYWDYD